MLSHEYSKFRKIGEATEAALITLVEKLNVYSDNTTQAKPEDRAMLCNATIRSKWTKVPLPPSAY